MYSRDTVIQLYQVRHPLRKLSDENNILINCISRFYRILEGKERGKNEMSEIVWKECRGVGEGGEGAMEGGEGASDGGMDGGKMEEGGGMEE